MYAVKKISLSPKLSKQFRQGKHGVLEELLREVQVLAKLEHANVVRYHATWMEEPHQDELIADITALQQPHVRSQLLLEDRSQQDAGSESQHGLSRGSAVSGGTESSIPAPTDSFRVVFEDSPRLVQQKKPQRLAEPAWSSSLDATEPLSRDDNDDILSDDYGLASFVPSLKAQGGKVMEVPTLHILMSLYPLTLAQYLSPAAELLPEHEGEDISSPNRVRHCFHLQPSLSLLLSILDGLQYIHANHLVHRDIKPANIFLSPPATEAHTGYCDVACHCTNDRAWWLNPRIGDFGLVAQLAHEGLAPETGTTKCVGTIFYRAPRDEGKKHDEKTDIFALGVVFVELLCSYSTAMERADTLNALQQGLLPDLGPILEQEHGPKVAAMTVGLVRGMIDPDYRQRWSGGQVKDAAERLLKHLSGPEVDDDHENS